MFKNCKVVMLPVNEKAPICKGYSKLFISDTNYKDKQYQHLYFLSDEEIKEGDWFYHGNTGISKCTKISGEMNIVSNKGLHQITACKKIIATTDKFLLDEQSIFIYGYKSPLPQPSDSFIEKFVEEYNKGNNITEVMVEYEVDEGYMEVKSYLKVNPKDNTITIRKVKESWNRDEVTQLLNDFHSHSYGGISDITKDKWIEENL